MAHLYVTRSVSIKHRAKRALFQVEQKSYRKTALRLTYFTKLYSLLSKLLGSGLRENLWNRGRHHFLGQFYSIIY